MRVAVYVFVPSPPLKSGWSRTDIKEGTLGKKVCSYYAKPFSFTPGCKKVAKIPENPEKF